MNWTRDEIRFVILVLAVFFAFLLGWLLVIGQGLLLPIFAAVISVYVLVTAADAMGRVPGLRRLPRVIRRLLVLLAFTLAIVGLGLVMAVTIDQLIVVAPTYRDNLEALAAGFADFLGLKSHPTWEEIRAVTIDRIDVGALLTNLVGSVTDLGGAIFLIVVYAAFLITERDTFARKLSAAFPRGDSADRTAQMITDINHRIGDYLAVKTLVNVIAGAISYVIMLIMGVDFALFWAVLIALFNYIPYVGSLVAVTLPIIISLAQFGSFPTSLALAGLLLLAQLFSDNFLEPRLVGKRLNLSPFVILVALSFWSAVWGLPGAILAVPMTSMLAIIFAGFPGTRFLAVFLAERGEDEDPPPDRSRPRVSQR